MLDGKKLNVGVIVFVSIKTTQHNPDWLDSFHASVSAIEEVLEVYRMAGDTDYLLRVAVPDVAAYDAVYKQLIRIPGLSDISSSFSMEQIKYSTSLPLRYAPDGSIDQPQATATQGLLSAMSSARWKSCCKSLMCSSPACTRIR